MNVGRRRKGSQWGILQGCEDENEKFYINEDDSEKEVLQKRNKQMTPSLESVGGRKNSDTISHR